MDCLANSKWRCIVCEKDLPLDIILHEKTVLPNIEGGTMQINFGWPSSHDQLESLNRGVEERYIACICDSCFDKKRHLTKMVRINTSTKYHIID